MILSDAESIACLHHSQHRHRHAEDAGSDSHEAWSLLLQQRLHGFRRDVADRESGPACRENKVDAAADGSPLADNGLNGGGVVADDARVGDLP